LIFDAQAAAAAADAAVGGWPTIEGADNCLPPDSAALLHQSIFDVDEVGEDAMIARRYLEAIAGDDYSIDLASYAASVSSGTAHLTSMNASPPNSTIEIGRREEGSSPHSNYFHSTHSGGVSFHAASLSNRSGLAVFASHPETEAVGCVSGLETLIPPPTNGWTSLGLSPIADVSPSIERLEQDRTQAENDALPSGEYAIQVHAEVNSEDEQNMAADSEKEVQSWDTSPTAMAFKRCASYSNIQSMAALADVLENKFATAPQAADVENLGTFPSVHNVDCFDLSAFEEFKQTELENGAALAASGEEAAEGETNAFTDSFTEEWFDTIVSKKQEHTNPFSVPSDMVASTETVDDTNPFIVTSEYAPEPVNPFAVDQNSEQSNVSMLSPSFLLVEKICNEYNFLSDEDEGSGREEDREIDLDEDIPPKHLLVRRGRTQMKQNEEQEEFKSMQQVGTVKRIEVDKV